MTPIGPSPTAFRRVLTMAPLCLPIALLTGPAPARAQSRWTVDPRSSLAWWQMSPNLNHLWATTCPEEPSWRPGEGRSAGWSPARGLRKSKTAYAAIPDTVNVPLYPRYDALPICTEAVRGEVVIADTVRWRGVRGQVSVRGGALVTGHEERDEFARRAILQTTTHPEIRFTVDSVVDVTERLDTIFGTAVGTFKLRDVVKPMTAAVRAWPEAGGLRVMAKFNVYAASLVSEYGLSSYALGLGVGTRIWQDLFMGVDLLLKSEGAPAGN
jgi:polyisoprenoid-binding protein YceI